MGGKGRGDEASSRHRNGSKLQAGIPKLMAAGISLIA
jgi:hypothetical protein